MTYSPETIRRMDDALKNVSAADTEAVASDWRALKQDYSYPNIGDTCCGNCGQGLCYVDGITGS